MQRDMHVHERFVYIYKCEGTCMCERDEYQSTKRHVCTTENHVHAQRDLYM